MKKILVVDDDTRVLSALKRELCKTFEVTTRSSGQAGLEALDGIAPDIVLSDFKMAEMDGAWFLAEVQRRRPAAVRVLISAYADLTNAMESTPAGAISLFLCKPWSADLGDVLQRLLVTP